MTASTVTRGKATVPRRSDRPDRPPISWVIEQTRNKGPKALQVSMAVLFVWFGAMKSLVLLASALTLYGFRGERMPRTSTR